MLVSIQERIGSFSKISGEIQRKQRQLRSLKQHKIVPFKLM